MTQTLHDLSSFDLKIKPPTADERHGARPPAVSSATFFTGVLVITIEGKYYLYLVINHLLCLIVQNKTILSISEITKHTYIFPNSHPFCSCFIA